MKKIIMYVVALLITQLSLAQVAPVDENKLAVGGYDVVAYFSGKATKGKVEIAAVHNGVTYRFSSKENKAAFRKNPEAYLPQYDGYCAWGVAEKSSKFPIDPETFKVLDGKLYLFFNGPFNGSTFNSLEPWNANEAELLSKAEKNWRRIQ